MSHWAENGMAGRLLPGDLGAVVARFVVLPPGVRWWPYVDDDDRGPCSITTVGTGRRGAFRCDAGNTGQLLGVAQVITEEVARLKMSVARFKHQHQGGTMPVLGGDPVSEPASRGFTEATKILLDTCESDIENLKRVELRASRCRTAYGKSDAEIQNMFARADASVPGVLADNRQ